MARNHFPVFVPPQANANVVFSSASFVSPTACLGNEKKRCIETDQIAGEDGNREINSRSEARQAASNQSSHGEEQRKKNLLR